MRFRSVFLVIILNIISISVSAQYYDTGQDPASLKWLQINTKRFKVIYPETYGANGIEFARSLDKAYNDLSSLFPEKKFRIPVIIHNYTTQSNGYVMWAPKRMEIYPTPEQNAIPLDEKRQLTLHEVTHVIQMESLNTGFSKTMSIILGQQFDGVLVSMLPLWYMEGDAVFAESVLSPSGRGRNADFQKELKGIVIEKGRLYKYDKMINGSFRDYIPDHYQFGYQMVAWSRATKDLHLWNKTLQFTATKPFALNPVNKSLKRNAGVTKKTLFIQTFDSLKTLWEEDLAKSNTISYEPINPSKNDSYINYYSPLFAGPDSIIAIKTSLSKPPVIVLISPSEKKEKKIHTPGFINPWFISYARGNLVWVETHADPRWENRNFSVIKLKDIKSGMTKQLSHKSRYMSASVSPDGKMIAASENTADNKNNLVFINPVNGNIIMSIPAPGNASLQHPQWSNDSRLLTVICLTEAGEGIMSYSVLEKTWKVLTEPSRNDLQSAFLRNDSLFFTASYSGTDNIFILTRDNKISEITRSKFGVKDLTVKGQYIMFTDYTSAGNNICKISLADAKSITFEPFKPVSYLIDRFDIEPGKGNGITETDYTPKPYRKWQHLLGLHSWMPFYADIYAIQSDLASARPGLTLLSQNQLSTLTATAGYEYSAEKRHMYHAQVSWRGWYPVFDSEFDHGNIPKIYKKDTDPLPGVIMPGYRFINTVSLPLKISSGSFSQFFYLSGSANFHNDYLFREETSKYSLGLTQMTGRFFFNNYYRYAFRDIYPEWAQVFDVIYSWYPFESDYLGSIFTLKSAFYFPGILNNNGIRIRFETDLQHPHKYYTGNRASFSRSYENITSMKTEFLSFDYVMPLAYPDFNISSLLYLKRIRSGLFYDYTRGKDNYLLIITDTGIKREFHKYEEEFKSFGFELLSDFYILRIPYMISAGVQTTWRSFSQAPYFRFLFNIDIYGTSIGRRARL